MHWPLSLRTMVAVMLDNPFGMYIAWGSEYTQIYNDGYRPILGATKHPQALGISTRETFSEIWHIIESMFDGVMEGKAVGYSDLMLPLNRYGFLEECYFDFSYSPIRKDDGEVGGVLVTVIETTEKKRIEKALVESNSRYINNILQAPVAMCIFRGKNHTVEIANDQMLQLWGKQVDQVINKPIFEGLPEAKDQGLEELLDKVYTTGEKFVANERPINLPRNGKVETTYVNFVYDALKETDGTISGIVAIAVEVTPLVIARLSIEESEQKVRAVVKNAPFPIAVYVGKEMTVELANPSIINIWGKGDDVIGKSFRDVLPELDNQLVFEQIERVLTTGESFHTKNTPLDLIVDNKLGTYYFNYSFTPLYDSAGNIYGVMNTGVDLTDLNIAKKRIEESEKRFRNLVEQAPVAICVLRGENYVVELANESQLALWRKTKEEVLGIPVFDAIPEGRDKGFEKMLNEVFSTGKPFTASEYPAEITLNGEKEFFYVNFTYQPLYDSAQKINGIISVAVDVTEQVLSRKIIQESEENFRSLAEALPQLTWVTDEKGNSEFASSKWKEYSGIEPGGEKEWKSIVHPDDYDHINAGWVHSLNTGSFYKADVRLLNKNGEYRWHTVNGEPIFDKEHKIIRWVGAFTDIHVEKTFSKALEDKVTIRTAELTASEEKFYRLFNLSPICKTLSDATTGKIMMVNDAFIKSLGYSREEVIDKTSAELGLISPESREIMINELKEKGKIENRELLFFKKSGEKFIALASAEIISMGDKNFFLSAFNDISEIKKAEQNINKKNMELENMNKELQSFAYISSHDLQEPLRKIQTFATRISEKEEHNLSDYGKDMFNRMLYAAQRMQTLIQDLLAYSRANTSERKFETTDLNVIMAEVKEDLKEELQAKNATIEVNQLCNADIIPFQFRQLMHNLIGNSLKFSKPNQPPLIQIKSEIVNDIKIKNEHLPDQNKYCHITFSDNGIGFEEQYNEKIFEVFQRLHGKNEYIGTGIGLSIVKKIVENHHGIITATGALNKGATFNIYIPVT